MYFHQQATVARDELLQTIECQLRSPGQRNCPNILSFLKPLIEQGTLDRGDVKHICLDLLFASHETTSSAACFLILYLSKYRDVFCKLRTELEDNGILGMALVFTYYSEEVGVVNSTHLSLASFLWDIGKQHSPRCDAAESGVPSGAILFA